MALSEKDLVTKIEIILKNQFNTELSFREISAGYGIADLVFAPSSLQSVSMSRSPITHFGTLKFFLNLRNRLYTLEELLSASAHVPQKDAKKYINFLVGNGYLVNRKGLYKKINSIYKNHPIQTIIAIEAKLTDYRNGILQAKRYQYFADQSYLAILKRVAKNINTDELSSSGIGLILFDEKTETVEILEPDQVVNVKEKAYNIFAKEVLLSRLSMASFS